MWHNHIMIKKNLLLLSTAVVSLTVGLFAAVASNSGNSASLLKGDEPETTYTLTIDSFSDDNYDGEMYTATTAFGNVIKFRIDSGEVGVHDDIENGCLFLGRGGYIRNHTELKGIKTLTVDYDILDNKTTKGRYSSGNSPVDFITCNYFESVYSNPHAVDSNTPKNIWERGNYVQFMVPDDIYRMESELVYQIHSISIEYSCSVINKSTFTFTLNQAGNAYNITVNDPNASKIAVPSWYLGKPVIAQKGFLKNCTHVTDITFERFPVSNPGDAGNIPLLYYFTDGDLPLQQNYVATNDVEYDVNSGYDCLTADGYANYDHEACATAFRNIAGGLINIRVLGGTVGSYAFYKVTNNNGNHQIEIGRDVTTIGQHAFEFRTEGMAGGISNTDWVAFHRSGALTRIESYAFTRILSGSYLLPFNLTEVEPYAFSNIWAEIGTGPFFYVSYSKDTLPATFKEGWNHNDPTITPGSEGYANDEYKTYYSDSNDLDESHLEPNADWWTY